MKLENLCSRVMGTKLPRELLLTELTYASRNLQDATYT